MTIYVVTCPDGGVTTMPRPPLYLTKREADRDRRARNRGACLCPGGQHHIGSAQVRP